MSLPTKEQTCVIIGASHAGVNLAFNLRAEGWEGSIHLYDADRTLPYHRPPLSKAYLTSDDGIKSNLLKSAESYQQDNISLHLGIEVVSIDHQSKSLKASDGTTRSYDKLALATGASALIPPIPGIEQSAITFSLRTAADVGKIKKALATSKEKRVVVIGGGYIGLETAASLKKMGASVTVLEREERVLSRVTASDMSAFFMDLHASHGVQILIGKNVSEIKSQEVICADGTVFPADLIVIGVGIKVNTHLAEQIGLEIENGIKVNGSTQTSEQGVYAIGDCSCHFNPHYDRWVRLESVQNAVDQSKVAAAAICGKEATYNTIPWFWSDQYDVKLQMVGLSEGYTEVIRRVEPGDGINFSLWYFKGEELLAVDAVNNAKAYVIGTKFIKGRNKVDRSKLKDPETVLQPGELLH
ncbi:MAG: NAD(P)/FAD-dependent oxidoreductase [Cyclobacteriaceae bacterium]